MAEGFNFSSEGFKEGASRNPPTFRQSSVNNVFGMGGQKGMAMDDQLVAQDQELVLRNQMVNSVLDSDGFRAMINRLFATL